jgi:hypothetical protein
MPNQAIQPELRLITVTLNTHLEIADRFPFP